MKSLFVRNLTNSPFDLEGGVRLPAMGSITESFSDEYADLLAASPGVEVSEAEPPSKGGEAEKPHAARRGRGKAGH